jgi:hypothetical protein
MPVKLHVGCTAYNFELGGAQKLIITLLLIVRVSWRVAGVDNSMQSPLCQPLRPFIIRFVTFAAL